MAAFPHRIISAVAKRITASLEFRCGDTCFIASIVAKPTDRSISSAHNAVAGAFLCPNSPVVSGKGQGTLMHKPLIVVPILVGVALMAMATAGAKKLFPVHILAGGDPCCGGHGHRAWPACSCLRRLYSFHIRRRRALISIGSLGGIRPFARTAATGHAHP